MLYGPLLHFLLHQFILQIFLEHWLDKLFYLRPPQFLRLRRDLIPAICTPAPGYISYTPSSIIIISELVSLLIPTIYSPLAIHMMVVVYGSSTLKALHLKLVVHCSQFRIGKISPYIQLPFCRLSPSQHLSVFVCSLIHLAPQVYVTAPTSLLPWRYISPLLALILCVSNICNRSTAMSDLSHLMFVFCPTPPLFDITWQMSCHVRKKLMYRHCWL